jgi:2-oxo-4-hydroxy-4-carboxy-5-ureidoimidazoline decarboxylase
VAADLLLRARRAIVDGAERSVAVVVRDGVVAEVAAYDADVPAREVVTLTDDELERALARHPRIGERADAQQHDAEHSAREQSGVDAADAALAEDLHAGNLAYEERFGRVYIIRAAGRDGPEILRELRRRLANDDATERAETIEQLTQIALLRIREVLS